MIWSIIITAALIVCIFFCIRMIKSNNVSIKHQEDLINSNKKLSVSLSKYSDLLKEYKENFEEIDRRLDALESKGSKVVKRGKKD